MFEILLQSCLVDHKFMFRLINDGTLKMQDSEDGELVRKLTEGRRKSKYLI